jgi:hypothetical protein
MGTSGRTPEITQAAKHYRRGLEDFRGGRFREAVAEGHLRLALCHLCDGDRGAALVAARRAGELGPTAPGTSRRSLRLRRRWAWTPPLSPGRAVSGEDG